MLTTPQHNLDPTPAPRSRGTACGFHPLFVCFVGRCWVAVALPVLCAARTSLTSTAEVTAMEVGSTPQSTPVTPQMPVLSAAAGPAYHQQPLASVSAAPSPTSVATSPPAAPASAALAVQSLQGARAHQPSDPTVFQLTDRQVLHHVAARPHCRGHVVQEILRSLQCRPRHQVVCGRCGAVQLQMRFRCTSCVAYGCRTAWMQTADPGQANRCVQDGLSPCHLLLAHATVCLRGCAPFACRRMPTLATHMTQYEAVVHCCAAGGQRGEATTSPASQR